MTLTWIWSGIIAISFIYAILSGNVESLSVAATEGAKSAVTLCIELCGITCFWCGIMKVFEHCGVMAKISKLLRPVINLLLPETKHNQKAAEYASSNISANLLGLGNAATPLGLKAISALHNGSDKASNDMCTFTVLNSASIQLIPVTFAAIRSTCGAQNAFDILPAVWITSIVSAATGVLMSKLLSRVS